MNNEITIEYLEEGVTKRFDLDGHGFTESIVFFITEVKDDNNLTLSILDINVENSSSDEILDCYDEVADVTFSEKFERKLAIVTVPEISEKLLILSGVDCNNDPVSEVFMYKGGKVRYLGSCAGTIESKSLRIEKDGTFFSNNKSEYFEYLYYVREHVIHRNELVAIYRWMYPVTTFDSDEYESFTYVTSMDYDFYDESYEDSDRTFIPEGTEVTFMTTSETGWFEVDIDGTSYYFNMTVNGEIDGDEDFTIDMLFSEISLDDWNPQTLYLSQWIFEELHAFSVGLFNFAYFLIKYLLTNLSIS